MNCVTEIDIEVWCNWYDAGIKPHMNMPGPQLTIRWIHRGPGSHKRNEGYQMYDNNKKYRCYMIE